MAGEGPHRRRAAGPGLFVFGTLMDADVRTLVIGRPLDAAQLQPAQLKNYRRVYIAGRLYPMVQPRRGSVVDGLLLSGLSEEDFARLDAFEGADYRRERQHVSPRAEDGEAEPVLAWFYRSRGAVTPSFRLWNLEGWRAREKAVFLRAARDWLTELGLRPSR
ncbi:MAG TPA: gamma-glutamylcyclotransferase family protein [Alphaproteobacteria bacterium]|jgi:gamma-glutamylcyclotransferase (GGCT)/AIG2-like uncharacterized protein YtfP